jgi:hypothetical protein
MLISNPLKKFHKNAPETVIIKTSVTNMSKSGKSAYFRHIFVDNFLGHFLKSFSIKFKYAYNSAFLIPFWSLKKFFKTLKINAPKTAQKTENLFYKHVLEFSYATIKRVSVTKVLKSLYPNEHHLYCTVHSFSILLEAVPQ